MIATSSVWRPIAVASGTTALVTLLSLFAPPDFASTLIGATFLGVGYWLVLRHDAGTIRAHGLSLGGVFEPGPLDFRELARSFARALGWAALFGVLVFPLFLLGYQFWFQPTRELVFAPAEDPLDEIAGQLFAIALPEELFYRGYLQSALDRAMPARLKVFGAEVGPGLLLASAIFAVGHLLTTPNPSRLSVFFPSLLFGWLRSRTGGIGAPVLFHAACNLFSAHLARGYGFMG
jgi:uncharacterized protein